MLQSLAIRDFVIVDTLELNFADGFTVLTGETGAGKSLLVDALSLVVGGRAEGAQIRQGKDRAEITAEFDVARLPSVQTWIAENGLEGDEHSCLLRRVLEREGRSRGFINGRAATLQQLREVGEMLVDIHGQFAHQSLLRAETQRALLDEFAGAKSLADEVAAVYHRWQERRRRRMAFERDAEAAAAERDELAERLGKLKALDLTPDTWTQLTTDHSRLSNAAALIEGVQQALAGLQDADGACLEQLSAIQHAVEQLQTYDPSLVEVSGLLEAASIQLREAVLGLRQYAKRLDLDPQSLAQLDQRMAEMHALSRRHKVRPEDLFSLQTQTEARLAELGGSLDEQGLAKAEAAAEQDFKKVADELTAARRKAAATLGTRVTKTIQSLAMGDGRFEVRLAVTDEPTAHGMEEVEFLIATHRSMSVGPLNKVASGGELSRVGLAVQVTASKSARVPTLIFDEVDSGIGGGVAEIVGKLLRELGTRHQVMCVTHLAQVAAQGQHHWQVAKRSNAKGVTSAIQVLNGGTRVDELARMLGGVTITETTRRHAAEMLRTSS